MRNILGQPTHDLWAVKIRSAALAVTAVPTLIKTGAEPLPLRKGFIVTNYSESEMWIGDENVTSATGTPLFPYWSVFIDAGADCDWYLVIEAAKLPGAGSGEARVIEGY